MKTNRYFHIFIISITMLMFISCASLGSKKMESRIRANLIIDNEKIIDEYMILLNKMENDVKSMEVQKKLTDLQTKYDDLMVKYIIIEKYNSNIPIGVVLAFVGSINGIPKGWLLCDGSNLDKNKTEYQKLFQVIGTIHGGDASPNFQLPDYRGLFLRGVSNDSNIDPDKDKRRSPGKNNTGNSGNNIGSIQDDEIIHHLHSINGMPQGSYNHGDDGGGNHLGAFKVSNSNETGGLETRPKNAYVYYIIKYQ